MAITLYDLVTEKGSGPFFSSNCFPARLALRAKRVPLETEEVTFHDLRFTWTPRLGVETATGGLIASRSKAEAALAGSNQSHRADGADFPPARSLTLGACRLCIRLIEPLQPLSFAVKMAAS